MRENDLVEWLNSSKETKKIERTGDQSLKFWYLFAERLENYRVPLKKYALNKAQKK